MAPRRKTLKRSCKVEIITGRDKSLFLRLFLSHRWVYSPQSAVCEEAWRSRTYIYSWEVPLPAQQRPPPAFTWKFKANANAVLASPRNNRQNTWRNETCLFRLKVWGYSCSVNINPLTFETVFPPMHNNCGEGGTVDSVVSMTKLFVSRTIKKLTYWPLPRPLSADMSSQ